MSREVRAHIALSAVAIIYGANYIIAKSVMPDPVAPNAFIALRVSGAMVLFWIFGFRRITIPDRSDWWRFILCACTGVITNQLLFFNGLSLTSPINGSIIMTSNPIIVMMIAAWMLRQGLTIRKATGVLLGALGAITLLLLGQFDATRPGSAIGDAFILINSFSYAFYLVLVKPLMKKYHPMNVITWIFTLALIGVLPFGGTGLYSLPWATLTEWQWFAIAYVIICVTFLTYLLNILALSVISPTTSSAYIYLQPLLAALFTMFYHLWLNEDMAGEFSLLQLICGGLIVIGVYLVSSSDRLKNQV